MEKSKRTPGFEDIERTFEHLEKVRKKEARENWLREHQEKKKPNIRKEVKE